MISGTIEGRKRRPGRPAKPEEERRGHTISVRANDAEYALFDARRVAAGGGDLGAYLRQAALAQRPPRAVVPELNREAWRELARAIGNLNQIAAHLNGGGRFDERGTPRMTEALDALRDEVRLLRLALLGPVEDSDE